MLGLPTSLGSTCGYTGGTRDVKDLLLKMLVCSAVPLGKIVLIGPEAWLAGAKGELELPLLALVQALA